MTEDRDLYINHVIFGIEESKGLVCVVMKDEFGGNEKRSIHTHEELYASMDNSDYQLFNVKRGVYTPVGFRTERRIQ